MRIPSFAKATLACLCLAFSAAKSQTTIATTDDGQWLFVDTSDVPTAKQHLNHEAMFKKYVTGYNLAVLKAVDIVQSHAMDGGGYFIGISAKPTESPIGYQLSLFQKPLLDPPRTTSYCSGSSYGVFIETLNLIFPDGGTRLSPERSICRNQMALAARTKSSSGENGTMTVGAHSMRSCNTQAWVRRSHLNARGQGTS